MKKQPSHGGFLATKALKHGIARNIFLWVLGVWSFSVYFSFLP